MTKIRSTSVKKYGISSHRFLELYHYCMQYNEWKEELKYKRDTVKSISINDMPMTGNRNNQTEELVIRRTELSRKCEIVEQTAIESDENIYSYILMGVTNEGVTYKCLKEKYKIPCGKDMYYDRRRKFYYLLSKKI